MFFYPTNSAKFILKQFSLQNLSFVLLSKTNQLHNTILLKKHICKSGLVAYLNLVFFFLQMQATNKSSGNSFVKTYNLKNYFILKNIKLVSSMFLPSSICFYLVGSQTSNLTSAAYGLFNKLFYCFSNYTDIFFSVWISNIYFIGVGYKVFIFNDFLYLRLGFSRMLKILIPSTVTVLTRKRNHLRIISSQHKHLESFLYLLKNLRVFDCYKGKGIFQNSNFSSVKLKVGKKQQFF